MAVCYITQLEIYPSNPQVDTLDIRKVEDAVNLLEDLNYIRSVIKAILGSDASKWNDANFIGSKNITEVWKRLTSVVTNTTSNIPQPTTLPPQAPIASYSVTGSILTNRAEETDDAFIPGEILFTYVFNKKSYISSDVIGHVFAEVPAGKAISPTVVERPVSVDFNVLDYNNNVIGTFSFTDGNNSAKIYKNPDVKRFDFLPGQYFKVIPISNNFSKLENLSFYIDFFTEEFVSVGDVQNIDLYTYIPNIPEIISKLDIDDGLSAPFTLLTHKNINSFSIDKNNPGFAISSGVLTAGITLNIYKNTTQVGTIVFSSGSNIGTINLTNNVTEFLSQDNLIVKTNSGVNSSTFSGANFSNLALNFKTAYKNLSIKLQPGIHGFIPGNIPDQVTIFSYVSPTYATVNFNESKFSLGSTPNRIVNLYVYQNNTRLGYLTFEPGRNIAKSSVQQIVSLSPGDCLYIKSGANNPTGASTVQNLSIMLGLNKIATA